MNFKINEIYLGRVAEKKHARSLKRLNVTPKQNRINTAIQIRKQKLQANKQTRETIGAIDGVPQIIVSIFTHKKNSQIVCPEE